MAQSTRAELITQTPLNFMTFPKIYPTRIRVALSSSRVLIFPQQQDFERYDIVSFTIIKISEHFFYHFDYIRVILKVFCVFLLKKTDWRNSNGSRAELQRNIHVILRHHPIFRTSSSFPAQCAELMT